MRAWSARRHGQDTLPTTINRRRIYILPTRVGIALGLVLVAMLLAGLNYNSNLGLAFGFFMVSMTLVIMHHCNRNMQSITLDVTTEADAFAGGQAALQFALRNNSKIERRDLEVRVAGSSGVGTVPARESAAISVSMPVPRRGLIRLRQFDLHTRYPFGWFHSWSYVHSTLSIYVAPKPAGNHALPSAEGAGSAMPSAAAGDEEFAGLRAYQPGMPLKYMAWKVLARGGEAAVRSYNALGAQPELLDWSYLQGMDDEARLSQLCLWVLESDALRRPYGLKIPGTEIAPSGGAAHRFACLRALAVYGADPP